MIVSVQKLKLNYLQLPYAKFNIGLGVSGTVKSTFSMKTLKTTGKSQLNVQNPNVLTTTLNFKEDTFITNISMN